MAVRSVAGPLSLALGGGGLPVLRADEDDDRRGVRDQFRWSLQALACDAEAQRSLFPDFVCKADELALDYDHWSEVARSFFAGEFSGVQLAALAKIDSRLDAMGRGGAEFEEVLWSEDALGTRPQWEELRSLAKLALACFARPPGSDLVFGFSRRSAHRKPPGSRDVGHLPNHQKPSLTLG